jgi:LacI family transcriptional regulator
LERSTKEAVVQGGRKAGRPTIIDVARHSGVSKSTVSNVIRGAEHLAEDTRARVLAAIDELGYRPNALARDLKRRRTATLGVIVGNLTNPFYAELTRHIEQHAARLGYATIICDTDGAPATERQRVHLLLEQRVSGIVMVHFSGELRLIEDAERASVPVVGVSVCERRFDCVATDDEKGARLAVEHLAGLGHERIAFVPSGYPEAATNAARQRGWRSAVRRAGLPQLDVVNFSPMVPGASQRDLLAALHGPTPPTAFFAGTDLTALELIDELERGGLSVPRDFSVVGFDGIAVGELRRLGLTTVRQPTQELANLGMERLFARIGAGEGGSSVRHTQRRLTPELVVRESTGPPR